MEPTLIPYQPSPVPAATRVLVLAPHPDDEVFGCGGAVAMHTQQGVWVQPLVLTSGEAGGDAATREHECREAAAILGTQAPEFWRLPDRGLLCDDATVARLSTRLREGDFALLYAPSPWEIHPDHRQAAALARRAALQAGRPIQLAYYEVGNPLRPNQLLDITAVAPTKLRAMLCFRSQLSRQDYTRQIVALNRFRTYTLASSVESAEAYYVLSPEDLVRDPDLRHLPVVAAGERTHADHSARPLVSVLIRSTDRPELMQALDSVSLQNHDAIEVVVQAVRPEHQDLPLHCGSFPLRLLRTDAPLSRSDAANRLLEAARGEWLLFLDDDDWLMPSHIGRLAATLASQTSALAAYSGVVLVDTQGQPIGQAFDLPFDGVRQMSGNLMPIHAVMFSRRLVERGCRFDPRLARYEDWDFWLQISRCTPLLHLPGISAAYRVHDSSGVHENTQQTTAWLDDIHNKWETHWTPEERSALMHRVWEFSSLEQRLLDAQQQIEALNRDNGNLQQLVCDAQTAEQPGLMQLQKQVSHQSAELEDLYRTLHAMRLSASWRLMAPLRWFSRQVGLGQVLRKGMRLFRIFFREGWRGVAYRLRHHPAWRKVTGGAMGYTDWVIAHDAPVPELLKAQSALSVDWPDRPLISVVMPVYNPPIELLREAVDSIRNQSYDHWELCLADDASSDPAVWPALEQLIQSDSRIKAVRRPENGHISAASNSALALATGDFIALMDNDDILSPDALHCVAQAIRAHPNAQVIYSDEDKLAADGQRFGGYMKSAWNHTLLLGHNLISHLGIYRRELVQQLGGFRLGYEGSQDYDLALRCVGTVSASDVVHIPKVLYHWRVLPGSTALGATEKPYALTSACRALNEHLHTFWPGARAEITPAWNYSLHPPRVDLTSRATLILVSSQPEGSQGTLQAAHAKLAFQCHDTVHCGSSTSALNQAIRAATTELILIVQDGLVAMNDQALQWLAGHLTRPGVALACGAVYNQFERLVDGGMVLSMASGHSPLFNQLPLNHPGYMGRAQLPQELSAAWFGCAGIRRDVFVASGGLKEGYAMDHWTSIDWCLRARECGQLIVWEPRSTWQRIDHAAATPIAPLLASSADAPPGLVVDSGALPLTLREQYAPWFANDPAYHPVLDAPSGDFSIRPVRAPAESRTVPGARHPVP